ncbi:hypothetical protein [Escherichia phage vB_EcoM_EP57]|nr:hypothetical protein [Escherichia phage vB_EcoM_EP57]
MLLSCFLLCLLNGRHLETGEDNHRKTPLYIDN